jgi:hypothetical protein
LTIYLYLINDAFTEGGRTPYTKGRLFLRMTGRADRLEAPGWCRHR